MNHAWGSPVERKHYNKGNDAPVKIGGMEKWEKALERMIRG